MTSTITEAFTLTEDFLQRHLFRGWEKEFYEIRPRMENLAPFGPYKYFYENCPTNILNKPAEELFGAVSKFHNHDMSLKAR